MKDSLADDIDQSSPDISLLDEEEMVRYESKK